MGQGIYLPCIFRSELVLCYRACVAILFRGGTHLYPHLFPFIPHLIDLTFSRIHIYTHTRTHTITSEFYSFTVINLTSGNRGKKSSEFMSDIFKQVSSHVIELTDTLTGMETYRETCNFCTKYSNTPSLSTIVLPSIVILPSNI